MEFNLRPSTAPSYREFVEKYFEHRLEIETGSSRYGLQCRVIEGQEGRVKFEFDVTRDVVDDQGCLARGCLMTILDTCLAMGFWGLYDQGIQLYSLTADMGFTIIDSIKEGDTLAFEVNTIKADVSRGFFKADVYRKSDNALIATAKQTMFFRIKSNI